MDAPTSKLPRTERGHRTRRALLDAALAEFAEKGFHGGSITGITGRAGVALGSFYTWFDSKDAIFRALVRDMSDQVKAHVAPALAGAPHAVEAERRAMLAFLEFAQSHKEIYRIIDEAEFADPESWRLHYATTAERIRARLEAAAARGEVHADVGEVHAWAIMGMNVFLGLRFAVWADDTPLDAVARTAGRLLSEGLTRR